MSQFTTKKIHHSSAKKSPATETPIWEHLPSKKKVRKIIGITLIILSLITGIGYAVQSIGNIRIGTVWTDVNWVPPVFQSTGTVAVTPPWVTNILIAGIGGAWHQAGTLTDSIMLASLDAEHQSVTMISIPRDLYVSYGTGQWAGKINTLYPIGLSQKEWISLLASKVSEITWQSIQHYMVVDFTAFRYIVNALDGIEIDVIKDLYDNEYPDYNYGYTVFSVKKWLQLFDGETALRYARSRHSTSDIDRSRRQQQIINAIKTKSLSAGVITSPSKISAIIDATRSNISTDMTVGDILSIGKDFATIATSDIHVYNLGDNCLSHSICSVGSYLYNPSMAYFGGAWAIIPEWARINQLSYYDRIRRFVEFIFKFPGIHLDRQPIVIVDTAANVWFARNLAMELVKIGINLDQTNKLFVTSTGSIESSYINIYWNEEYKIGIDPESEIVSALKMLDMRIPVRIVTSNEYVKNDGPKIEIVLGKDYKEYFKFSSPVSYLPKIENPLGSGNILSGESKNIPKNITTSNTWSKKNIENPTKNTNTTPYKINPGGWEEF